MWTHSQRRMDNFIFTVNQHSFLVIMKSDNESGTSKLWQSRWEYLEMNEFKDGVCIFGLEGVQCDGVFCKTAIEKIFYEFEFNKDSGNERSVCGFTRWSPVHQFIMRGRRWIINSNRLIRYFHCQSHKHTKNNESANDMYICKLHVLSRDFGSAIVSASVYLVNTWTSVSWWSWLCTNSFGLIK